MTLSQLNFPLLHFLLIGAVLAWSQAERGEPKRIVVDSARIEEQLRVWTQLSGRIPNEEERQSVIHQVITDELLFREALSLRLDLQPVAVNRLVQLSDFLQLTRPEASRQEKYRAALALELNETDPVIRRYVVNTLRSRLELHAVPVPLTPEAIRDYYHGHTEEFRIPARYRLSHAFVGGTGKQSYQRAIKLRQQLIADGITPPDTPTLGDVFYGGHQLPLLSEVQIATRLGPEFAGRVSTLKSQQWSAPTLSPYGWHLVWVQQSEAAKVLPLKAVREKVVEALYARNRSAALAQNLAELRRKYRIEISGLQYDS